MAAPSNRLDQAREALSQYAWVDAFDLLEVEAADCVLREAAVPMDHDAQRIVRHGDATLLVELGRDREAAQLELEIITTQPNTSKGRIP